VRSATQGRATFTMEFYKYEPAPEPIKASLINKNG
jgi:translation elongation factor EF-G